MFPPSPSNDFWATDLFLPLSNPNLDTGFPHNRHVFMTSGTTSDTGVWQLQMKKWKMLHDLLRSMTAFSPFLKVCIPFGWFVLNLSCGDLKNDIQNKESFLSYKLVCSFRLLHIWINMCLVIVLHFGFDSLSMVVLWFMAKREGGEELCVCVCVVCGCVCR